MRLGLLNVRKGLLQLLLPGLKMLPPRTASRVVGMLGRAEYYLNLPLRQRFGAALRRGAAHFGCEWDVHRIGSALAANHLRWRTRDHLLDGLSNERAEAFFEVDGRDHLDAALAENKGVLLLFNHFGAFLMPAHWLIRHEYPLRWLTERPRNISKLVRRTFQTDGPLGQEKLFMSRKAGPGEGGSSVRRAVRILQAGMIVQVAGDVRWEGPRSARAEFLGNSYNFSTTWVSVAALSGSPVVPAFGIIREDGTYRLEFAERFTVPPDVAKSGDFAPWVQMYLNLIEDRVRHEPANSTDYFFWAESAATPVPAMD
jgi:KDO2-lipid IV(A) lauroyltransferase